MRIVLGIDPGLKNTGYGVVGLEGNKYSHLAHGTIVTSSSDSTEIRLHQLFRELKQIIKTYKIMEAGIEDIYFAKNAKTLVPSASAKGVLMLACAEYKIPVTEYSPLVIKRAVVGNGRADKQQVQNLVRVILGLSEIPKPDHAADALAAALCHLQQKNFHAMVKAAK